MFENRYVLVTKRELKAIAVFGRNTVGKFKITLCEMNGGWEISYVRKCSKKKSKVVAALVDQKKKVIHFKDIGAAAQYIYDMIGHYSFDVEVDAVLLETGVYPTSTCDYRKDVSSVD